MNIYNLILYKKCFIETKPFLTYLLLSGRLLSNDRHLAYSLVWRIGSFLGKNSLPIDEACHELAGRAA